MFKLWIFNCRDVSEKMSGTMDTRPPWSVRLGIGFHVMMCKYCLRYQRQLKLIRDLLRLYGSQTDPSPALPPLPKDVKLRIKQTIRNSLDR